MASLLLVEPVGPNELLVLSGLLTQTAADARYLKLAADNDPLTGQLNTQTVVPNLTGTYNLGDYTTPLRWLDLNATRLRVVNTSPTTTTQSTTGHIIGYASTSGSGATTLSSNSSSTDGLSLLVATAIASAGTATARANSRGSVTLGYVRNTGSSTSNLGMGNLALGSLCQGWVDNASSSAVVLNALDKASFVSGGVLSIAGDLASTLTGSASGGFVQGYIISGPSFTSVLTGQSTAPGSFTQGHINLGGLISSYAAGAFTQGYATNGGQIYCDILSTGGFAHGAASGGNTIISTYDGDFAAGSANNGNITASGGGIGKTAFAFGSTLNGAISATGNNTMQLGPGTNAEADTLKIGTAGLRLKGTTTAPGTPVNGDVYMGSTGNAFVLVRSNAANVILGPVNTWTTATYATRRNFATAAALIGTLTTTGATSDFSIQAVTNTAPFGFVNAAEGDTLVNSVANLQTRTTELYEILETLVEDLRIANII